MPSAEEVAVAIYNTHDEAEQAVKTLAQASFDMQKLSISRASVPLAQEGMRLLTFAPET
jgi:hypothetical protein